MIKHITFSNIYRGTRYLFKNGPSSVIPKIKQVLKIGNMYGEWFPKHRITEEELEKQREYHFAYEFIFLIIEAILILAILFTYLLTWFL